jgi:hypothetical protein
MHPERADELLTRLLIACARARVPREEAPGASGTAPPAAA